MRRRYLLVGAVLVLVGTSFASAQEAPRDALSPLREKSSISDEEQQQIRTFVTQRVSEVVGQDPAAARAATASLRQAYVGEPAFRKAYAGACLDAFGTAIRRGDVRAAARLLTLLASFNLLEANTLFIDNLQDDRAGVRAAAAVGLRALRPQLVAAGEAYSNALNALNQAGKQEKSRATLRSIYAAMDYDDVAQGAALKTDISSLLDLLEQRSQPYAERRDAAALGADDAGLSSALRLLPQISAEQRNQLLRITARMMRYAIEQYRAPEKGLTALDEETSSQALLAYRNAMERLVYVGEDILEAVLEPSPAPELMERMSEQDTAGMKLEWDKWNELLKKALNEDFALQEAAASDEDPTGP